MRTFFTSLLLIGNFCIAVSQQTFKDFDFNLSDKEILNSIKQYNQNQLTLSNARTSEEETQFLLDSLIQYSFISEEDSTPLSKTLYFPDEYGNDTLEISYNWNNTSQLWEQNFKKTKSINPQNQHINFILTHQWNAILEGWYLSVRNLIFYDSEDEMDSTLFFYYSDSGELTHTYKRTHESNLTEKLAITIESYYYVQTDSYNKSKSEIYQNDQGNTSKEYRYAWDKEDSSWNINQKTEYSWDTLDFRMISISYRWQEATSSWISSSRTTESFNPETLLEEAIHYFWDSNIGDWKIINAEKIQKDENGYWILLGYSNWSESAQELIPFLEVNWSYDSSTGDLVSFYEYLDWNNDLKEWQSINHHIFQYDENGLRASISIFTKNNVTGVFEIKQKTFYHYSQKDILTEAPDQTSKPIGIDTLCVNAENTTYKTSWKKDIKSFLWKIIPEEAGAMEATDSLVIIDWKEDFSGLAGLVVAGVNGFGVGKYSDTLDIFIKTPPGQPASPDGPDILNQFSGVVEYVVEIQEELDEYIWKLEPDNSGVLSLDNNIASFILADQYEGEFYITVQAKNECGISLESEQFVGMAELITGLQDKFNDTKICIYPNPTNGNINISYCKMDQVKCVKIVDLKGNYIWEESYDFINRNNLELNLLPGVYSLVIETNTELLFRKIVVK